ncbi:hypothetical protein J6T21_03185 [Candidatus Saccharibacteria bacterium]|nr:hypothetical protein [Candidatus Saccharibacteria bacterium]
MITVNHISLPWGVWNYGGIFPSGETKAAAFAVNKDHNTIILSWDPAAGESDLLHLFYAMSYIKARTPEAKNTLIMEYVPNARLDKPLGKDINGGVELLPLNEYTADYVNSLGFDQVIGIEPHSSKFVEKYRHSIAVYPTMKTLNLISRHTGYGKELQIAFPDEGSFERYRDIISKDECYSDYLVVRKSRVNGEVCNVEFYDGKISAKKDLLVVDDICSRGSTALETAKVLLEKCPMKKKVYLLVAYLEQSSTYAPHGILSEDSPFEKIFVCGPNPFEKIINPKVEYLSYNRTY